MEEDTRWKQRFENFSNAFSHFEYAVVQLKTPNDLEKEGTIQRFEFTHELSWKVMKDFLEDKGIKGIIGSRNAVRHAFQNGLITDGQVWMDMIESRNKTVHTYVGEILTQEYTLITRLYYPLLAAFYQKMKTYL
ncbi:nucleotidyltransferase substrate binding protein [Parasediminibacterium sp. JCM 36343]|uniref:nucleotidyltransferase substrate binding protein n=1 Tax=Parasediminibacterium sp. JCM 36343 TaxID=3374279 RepID=UPI00397A9329